MWPLLGTSTALGAFMRVCASIAILFAAGLFRLQAAGNFSGETLHLTDSAGREGTNLLTHSTQFPFEYSDDFIWVEVRVRESSVPLRFLLDSGAGASVVNLPTLARIGKLEGRRIQVKGVGTTTSGYWPEHLTGADDTLPLPKNFVAVDLSELGRKCQQRIDGLLGADFFAGRCVQIDFASRCIRLLSAPATEAGQIELPLRQRGGALRVPISVNYGPSQWVRLDTGCAAALHWVSTTISLEECRPHVSVALAAVGFPETEASIELGSLHFDSVAVGVHKTQIFPGEAGLLGNGLLSRFESVTIDTRAGRVVLTPSKHPEAVTSAGPLAP
jgi:hypothetical protein